MDLATLLLAAATLLVALLVATRQRSLPREAPVEPGDAERIRKEVHRVAKAESDAVRGEVGKRLEKIDERLEEVARIARGLVEREPRSTLAEEVEPVLREAVESLEARIGELASAVVDRRVETVHQTVTRVLGEKGYTDVQIIEEPRTEGARTRVLVNARRDGMPYKGSVHLEGATVVEQSLAPSYPMFP